MKKNSLFFVTMVICIIVFSIIIVLELLYKKNVNTRVLNIKGNELSMIVDEFDNKYKDYTVSEIKSFTPFIEDGYLRLVGMKNFDKVYATYNTYYLQVELYSGVWPTNDKEIVLPKYMESGSEVVSKYAIGYELGDHIQINAKKLYDTQNVSITSTELQNFEVKHSVACTKEKLYVEGEYEYDMYKVVGFYEPVVLKDLSALEPQNFLVANDIDVITYSDLNDLNEDSRLNIVFELKKYAFSKNEFLDFVYSIQDKYSRNEESVNSVLKTCNDKVTVDYMSNEEIIEMLN